MFSRHGRIERFSALMAVVAALAAPGCGSGGGGGTPSSQGPPGLWVPSLFSSIVAEFLNAQIRESGAPSPRIAHQTTDVLRPNQILFDPSGNLWISYCSNPMPDRIPPVDPGAIVEFKRSQLKSLSTNPAPAVMLQDDGFFDIFFCPYGMQFDSSGNLWIVNRFIPDLIEFTPDRLKTSGVVFPNTRIFSFAFSDIEGIQFDRNGTLWITGFNNRQVSGFKAATLAEVQGTTTIIEPDIINSSPAADSPDAVVFDKAGNQWVTDFFSDRVVQFLASDLTASGSPTPAVILESANVTTPTGMSPSLSGPEGLAFDKDGNLWVANEFSDNFGSIAKFTPDQLTASGSPVPKVFIDSNADGTNLNAPVLLSFGPSVR